MHQTNIIVLVLPVVCVQNPRLYVLKSKHLHHKLTHTRIVLICVHSLKGI